MLRRNPNEIFQVEAVELALQELRSGKDVKQKNMIELDVCAMTLIWNHKR